jgi:hypothetical protein
MGLRGILIKQILLLGLVFYILPGFWWTYNAMDDNIGVGDTDDDASSGYFLSVRFLMSTGSLMTVMGMGYVALPIDLVPDFIPIFGGIDNTIAKLTAGGGLMMAYMGYKFGTGETPREFDVVVTAVKTVYNVVMPILQDKVVVPVVLPAMKAMLVPMKVAAKSFLGTVIETVQDPKVQERVQETVQETVMSMMGDPQQQGGARGEL